MLVRLSRKNDVLTESNANRAGPEVPLETGGYAAGDEVSVGHVRTERRSEYFALRSTRDSRFTSFTVRLIEALAPFGRSDLA